MLIDEREMIMNEAVMNLVERIKQDYINWTQRCADVRGGELTDTNKEMIARFVEEVEFEYGRKYIKVLQNKSAWGFIVAVDNDKKFKYGDILMAAGYNAPARNKARGNVFELDGLRVQWTGANYL